VSNQLIAIYMNSRSLKALVHDNKVAGKKISKLSLFQNLIYTEQYDVVCVCETWLRFYQFTLSTGKTAVIIEEVAEFLLPLIQ
jgi:hypothetical protein